MACAESAILRHVDGLAALCPPPARPPHRVPLGLLLLARGDLSEGQLQLALEAQQQGPPRKIGDWLQVLQFASERQVLSGLGLQWGLPLLSSPASAVPAARLLPRGLRSELRLVPVRFLESTNELYLATSGKPDYTILAAIEHMLGSRILPCLVSERVMSSWLEHVDAEPEDLAQHFERTASLSEITRITSSYATRLHSDDLRITRCGPYIWVRLLYRGDVAHLLFRLDSAAGFIASPHLPTAV